MQSHNHHDTNICFYCQNFLEQYKDKLNLSQQELSFLKHPGKTFAFALPLTKDNGEIKFYNGYRVQYSSALGPTKGGIRFHPKVNLPEVQMLAFLMALKCSLVNIPYGGAKGGVDVDPQQLSLTEKERLSRSYIRYLHNNIGPDNDIPAPDVNTDAQTMAWMMDEYSRIKDKHSPAVITGKPLELGGSEGREEATSLGGIFVLENFLKNSNQKISNLTFAIQGFGNVGAGIAKFLHQQGAKIIALSDAKQAYYNANGLDIEKIFNLQKEKRFLPTLPDTQNIKPESLLELEVDVLIPAAIGGQINQNNAKNIQATTILEMANAPITPEAENTLKEKKTQIIPDILANAGGVIVSYFEWVQNRTQESWPLDKVNQKLKEKITTATENIYNLSQKNNCDLRTATYEIAIQKILKAEKLKGNL